MGKRREEKEGGEKGRRKEEKKERKCKYKIIRECDQLNKSIIFQER